MVKMSGGEFDKYLEQLWASAELFDAYAENGPDSTALARATNQVRELVSGMSDDDIAGFIEAAQGMYLERIGLGNTNDPLPEVFRAEEDKAWGHFRYAISKDFKEES